MSRRAKGTYTLVENRAAAYIKQTRDASSSVLMALVERSNYSNKGPMTIAELMVETGLMQRAVEKALARLELLGLASKCVKAWTFPKAPEGASDRSPVVTSESAPEGASRSANHGTPERTSQSAYEKAYDGTQNEEEKTVSGSKDETLKEVEGSKKESKDKKTPLTPQGGREGGKVKPAQGEPESSEAQSNETTSTRNVPRRRAAAIALPDDLAAVPGMPEAWERWHKYAREIRLQLKESTAEAQFKKLRDLLAEGRDLPQHVDHAIEHGWRSFFPIRGETAQRNLRLPAPEPETPRTREEWLS